MNHKQRIKMLADYVLHGRNEAIKYLTELLKEVKGN